MKVKSKVKGLLHVLKKVACCSLKASLMEMAGQVMTTQSTFDLFPWEMDLSTQYVFWL
jgi:hypothetical protein